MRMPFDLSARDKVMSLGRQTRIMGIINCTPDSFSGDGRLASPGSKMDLSKSLRYARQLIRDGADMLDIGGESTRPGSLAVSIKEEISRVIPTVEILVRHLKVPISVDTAKIEIAHRSLDAGASIINNIMGHQLSPKLLKLVRDYNASIVVMHMRGSPVTMQSKAKYKDLVKEVVEELKISVEKCLAIGIKKERIIVDPGIGFAKTADQNLLLINKLDKLSILNCPILLGVSRKSFIGEILEKDVNHRLMGTAAAVAVGVMQGAHIVRVHDIKAIKETIKITDAILNAHT